MQSSEQARPGWLKAAPAIFLLLWSSGFVFLKLGLAFADPLTFLALRYALVLAVVLPLVLWLRPAWPREAGVWGHLAVIGLLLQAGYFSLTYVSLDAGMSAGGIALITSQQPILVGLLAPWVAGERVAPVRWLGLALGVAGACLVVVAKSGGATATQWLAWAWAGLALLALTSGTLWEKRFGRSDVHPGVSNLVQYATGLLTVLPLAVWLEPLRVQWAAPGLWYALAYLVLANSLVAMTLLLAMIRWGEAARVSALFFLVPPATAVIAALVLGEHIPALAWAGMLLAVIGIFLVTRQRAVS
ncbi:MAG: DMT family transporter, partial [Comamonas sp.]